VSRQGAVGASGGGYDAAVERCCCQRVGATAEERRCRVADRARFTSVGVFLGRNTDVHIPLVVLEASRLLGRARRGVMVTGEPAQSQEAPPSGSGLQ
jgi:hypothetical protein